MQFNVHVNEVPKGGGTEKIVEEIMVEVFLNQIKNYKLINGKK